MKKLLVVFVVLAMVCLSSMAFAADVTVGGSVQIRSRDFDNMSFDKNDKTKNAVDTQERIILNVNAKAGDDVKGKISLWNDFNDWGTLDQNQGNGFGSAGATTPAGGPTFNSFGFREAWVSFNVPGVPVNVTAGHQLLQLGNGFFFRSMHYGTDAWVVANQTGNNTAALVDVKVSEGATIYQSDDVDAYVLLDVFKIDDNNTVGASIAQVADRYGLAKISGGAPSSESLYNLEVTYAGKLGAVNLKGQVDVQTGTSKNANLQPASGDAKFKGNQIAIQGNIPLAPVTINFLVARGSGNKQNNKDVDKFVTFLDVDPHYTFLYEYKLATAAGAVHTGFANTTVASVGALWAATKSLNLGLDVFFLQATEKVRSAFEIAQGTNGTSSDVGTEIDAKVYWKLYDNLSWNWDLGYFKPGAALKTASGKTDAATGIQGVLAFSF
jgi:hypothetical protein